MEQKHIIGAFAFELGKCEIPQMRSRTLANLRNVHEDLAAGVAAELGRPLPPPASAAVAPRTDLDPSPALSVLGTAEPRRPGP